VDARKRAEISTARGRREILSAIVDRLTAFAYWSRSRAKPSGDWLTVVVSWRR
jgi:hypothetical protein